MEPASHTEGQEVLTVLSARSSATSASEVVSLGSGSSVREGCSREKRWGRGMVWARTPCPPPLPWPLLHLPTLLPVPASSACLLGEGPKGGREEQGRRARARHHLMPSTHQLPVSGGGI